MSTSYAVRIDQLAKSYIIAHEHRPTTLGEAISSRVRQPLKKRVKEEFWALRDVSFDIAQGEVVGIIGRNGAGKSTLLKILSRIVSPTKGQVEMCGRVGSLLEVGTGFHAELTGRENIFLNGSILGMRHREIERHFDAIVDFAGVEQFLDTPVKRYSSGMYVRLAFAVAAHLRSDILIIDEVLAVGDAEFQKKCLGKMQSIANEEGRTILFVSHNMLSVQSLCRRCILLNKGLVYFDGISLEAAEQYLAMFHAQAVDTSRNEDHGAGSESGELDLRYHDNPYGKQAFIEKVCLLNANNESTSHIRMFDSLNISVDINNGELDTRELANSNLILTIRTETGTLVATIGTHMKPPHNDGHPSRRERLHIQIPQLHLTPGTYFLDFLWRTRNHQSVIKLDRVSSLIKLHVHSANIYQSGYEFSSRDGVVCLDMSWERQKNVEPPTLNDE